MRLHLNISKFIFMASLMSSISGLQGSFVMAQGTADNQTLKQQLDATNKGFAENMPAPLIKSIDDAVNDVTDTGILDNVKKVGDRAPDFTLPDATGKNVQLSSLLKDGPVVLTWYRGNW